MHETIKITRPDALEFQVIKDYIHKFELDNRSLNNEQFLVAKQGYQIIGFGRIREYEGCSELCSLGVIEPERNKGIGRSLTNHLVKIAKQPLYLVCIIPDFFKPFGFVETNDYPFELQDKLEYCTSELVVPEPYVVMRYSPL